MLPTPSAQDSSRGGSSPDVRRSKGQQITLNDAAYAMGVRANHLGDSVYGRYDAAVRRWEEVFRPAPYPVDINSRGNEHLAPRFSEWMMGLPEGWVTSPEIGQSRAQQLKAIGNGVVPQQALVALTVLFQGLNGGGE